MGKSLRSKKCQKNRAIKRSEGVFGQVAAARESRLSEKLLEGAKATVGAEDTELGQKAFGAAAASAQVTVAVVDTEMEVEENKAISKPRVKRKHFDKTRQKRRRHRN